MSSRACEAYRQNMVSSMKWKMVVSYKKLCKLLMDREMKKLGGNAYEKRLYPSVEDGT